MQLNATWMHTPKQAGARKKAARLKKKNQAVDGLEHLYIRNAKVDIGAILSDKTMSAPLPDIRLTDIGKQKNGAPPGEVREKIVDALANHRHHEGCKRGYQQGIG
jgi:hypothetical protein